MSSNKLELLDKIEEAIDYIHKTIMIYLFSLYLLQSKEGTPGMREALTNPHPRKTLSDSSSTVGRDGALADTANQILCKPEAGGKY